MIKYIQKELKSEGVIVSTVPMGQDDKGYRQKIKQVKQFEDFSLVYENENRLTGEVIGTAALWAEHHKAKICLADLPRTLLKYNTINTYSLLDMETQLNQILYDAYLNDQTLYQSAMLSSPDLLLSQSDEYMAALVNKLSETGEYKNIMVLCGYG